MTARPATVEEVGRHVGASVELRGWLYNRRKAGKLQFLIIRDGTGFLQAVASEADLPPEVFELCRSLGQESSILARGVVRADPRSPGGYELSLTGLEALQAAEEYPISLKEHGADFLLDHRHLWLRTPRQHAIIRVRAEVIAACRDFLDGQGFLLVDTPILTPAACEGTTTLFETGYFDTTAYLAQSGQLYNEAAAMAFGRVYCFGPTFRAEKSRTRRHLMEFWMVEPEAAYLDFEGNLTLQEAMIVHIVERVLAKRRAELERLERDTAPLEGVRPPFPRVSYDEALRLLEPVEPLAWGEDFGAPHEVAVAGHFDRPVFVHRFPAKVKAFYMKPDPERPDVVLGADLLAPEGYGEIIGGGERLADHETLRRRIREHGLPEEAFRWYLDLRRYGSVPHSGFGLGIERVVAWLCGLEHIREAIPFPRLLNRIYP
ncbi:MAG: asparagine--tRNA ligase [bacterium]|nr:asparagine--tRNA ligase [bacterium]